MKIHHELIKVSTLSRKIGLSDTALHMKKRGLNYQRLTEENESKIKPELFDMIEHLFEIESIEVFNKFIDEFKEYLGYESSN